MKTFRYLIAGLLLLAALPSQSKEEEISFPVPGANSPER